MEVLSDIKVNAGELDTELLQFLLGRSGISYFKQDHLFILEEIVKLLLRLATALLGHHLVELALLNQLCDNIDSTNELAVDKHLRESRPLRVELQPLADSFVLEDV